MIYCVIATDPKTGNEWVMPKTAETIVEIGAVLDGYRESDSRFEYRIDLVPPGATVKETDTEFLVRGANWKIFTARELFPPGNGITTSDCIECGAYVRITMQNRHAQWHNKIADL